MEPMIRPAGCIAAEYACFLPFSLVNAGEDRHAAKSMKAIDQRRTAYGPDLSASRG